MGFKMLMKDLVIEIFYNLQEVILKDFSWFI